MNETIDNQSITKSLRLLSNGFKNEFATFVALDERTSELLMELSTEFVSENIPVVDEQIQIELAMMLMESIGWMANND